MTTAMPMGSSTVAATHMVPKARERAGLPSIIQIPYVRSIQWATTTASRTALPETAKRQI